MAAKNSINVCFIGNPRSGKNTIIQGLVGKILPKHDPGLSYQVCYSEEYNTQLSSNNYVHDIYFVNFKWGKETLFNVFLTKYHNDHKMIIENIQLCDYIIYTIDSTQYFKEDILFLEYMFKTIQDKKLLTKVIIVCNKYDIQFKNKINEFSELITIMMNKYDLKNDHFYRIDARKMMMLKIFRSTGTLESVPESILHDFYNEYFGKLRANKLLTGTSEEIKLKIKGAFSELSLTDDEKNFRKYMVSIPNNRDYFQEKCAVLTTQVIEFMDKNYEKDIDEYLKGINNIINDNVNIFTDENKITIYQNAFSKYYQLNTTQFRININFVNSVFLKLNNFLNDDFFSDLKNDLKLEYFEKTLDKILKFNDPKNFNFIELIKYSNDNQTFYRIFMDKYIPHAIKHTFYRFKIIDPDETSDEEDEEISDNNNKYFMIIMNYMIKFIETTDVYLFNVFFFEKVLCNLKYQPECILRLVQPLYKYTDHIYDSIVGYYREKRPEYLMKMKYNYVNKKIFIEYEEIMNNPIIQLIEWIDDKLSGKKDKDFFFPDEIIRR